MIFAETLTRDTPAIHALLRRGEISEWSAQITARETTGLPRHIRRAITTDLAPDLPEMSPRQIEAAVRRAAYTADPRAIMTRARTAHTDRRVTIRPAPDTMALQSAFLPAEQSIAAWANLQRHAQTLKANGDPRTLGQIMADTLVQRLTGQHTAAAIPVEIGVTMTLESMLDRTDEPAHLHNYGPLPADLARNLIPNAPTTPHTATTPTATTPAGPTPGAAGGPIGGAAGSAAGGAEAERTAGSAAVPVAGEETGDETGQDAQSRDDARVDAWLRRIITDPITNTVITVDPRRRRFPVHLARLIRYRDQTCRDPYCTAPIRHLDHTHPHADGGPTTADNGAGLCERGNYTKDMPGWTRTVTSTDPASGASSNPTSDTEPTETGHAIEITTPTGHRYTTTAPPALGPGSNTNQLNQRAVQRRMAYLARERLINSLPSPSKPSDTQGDGTAQDEPP